MMIYKPSKLINSSVHIDRVYHFIRDHFSQIPLYTYISFNGPEEGGALRQLYEKNFEEASVLVLKIGLGG